MIMEMLRAGDVKEDDDMYLSPLDVLFERLEVDNPEHIALKYYRDYHSGSAKTLKSIQITKFYEYMSCRIESAEISKYSRIYENKKHQLLL